jgi:hypothetical protein
MCNNSSIMGSPFSHKAMPTPMDDDAAAMRRYLDYVIRGHRSLLVQGLYATGKLEHVELERTNLLGSDHLYWS